MCRLIMLSYQITIWTSSVISDLASMYSLVSLYCSCHFFVIQLYLKLSSFCVTIYSSGYSHQSFLRVLKININTVKLTFPTAISFHQVMRVTSKKCEVWKIYQAEYGPFFANDWLKKRGNGRGYGLMDNIWTESVGYLMDSNNINI